MTFNKFRFGKYKGRAVGNVPRDYLEWYLRVQSDSDSCKYKEFNQAVRDKLAEWDNKKPKGEKKRLW